MKNQITTFVLLLALLLSVTGTALAEGEVLPCEGDQVSGTVIAVDEESNTVTIATESGECSVGISDDDYGHPITNLLAAYFGEDSVETLTASLEAATVCAVYDESSNTWSSVEVAEAEECPGSELLVTSENEDGTFNASTPEGEPASLSVEDEEAAAALSDSVDDLAADWEITDEGSISDLGDEIAAYHEDGWGYGELVKIYAIVAESEEACAGEEASLVEGSEEAGADDDPCAVTSEYLISLLEDGAEMGDLFAIYGKPSLLGVGHVRMALNDSLDGTSSYGDDGEGGDGDGDGNGICNARANGGNAYSNGKDVDC